MGRPGDQGKSLTRLHWECDFIQRRRGRTLAVRLCSSSISSSLAWEFQMTATAVRRDSSSVMPAGRERQLLTFALLIATATVAFETQVVTVALPSITGELQGISLYPWVFSGYLLMSTITAPLYGKLADVFGRRPLFFFGFTVFMAGTFLCGAATSMPLLVGARVIQGVGAGAILPLVLTVLGDIYTIKDRARVQGASAGVWGFFSFLGPSTGAFIIESTSWRWVFWSNLPLCIVALALLAVFLREGIARKQVNIDYAGAATLTGGVVCILLVALEGGRSLAWGGTPMVLLVTVGVALLVLFGIVERRAVDPILPFGAFRIRAVAVGNAGNMLIGAAQFLLTSFLPLLIQGVRGEGATATGLVLTAFGFAWSLAAMIGGRLFIVLGFRRVSIVGTGLVAIGCLGATLASDGWPVWVIATAMALTGIGQGISSTAFLYAPQASVPWNQRGAVTSSTQFARNMVGAVLVAIGGGWLNTLLFGAATLSGATAEEAGPTISKLLSVSERGSLDATLAANLGAVLGPGLQVIFGLLALLALVICMVMIVFAREVRPVEEQPVHSAVSD